MECIVCGNWFSSTDKTKKLCMTCERVLQHPSIGIAPERLLELAQAEKDGRLVVLPCKIMDTIFMAVGRYGITGFEEDRCDGFFINREGVLQIKAQCYSGNHATYGLPGETVFLTREEAEAELKEKGEEK